MMRPNLYDYLKVLAIITMIIDHLGYYLFPESVWMRLVGRIAFPIFLFLVWYSWSYKWRRDLFFIGVGLQIFLLFSFFSFGYWSSCGNILLGIILARGMLYFLEKKKKNWILFVVILLALVIHPRLREILDYGSFTLLFALWGRIAKKKSPNFLWGIFILIALFCHSIFVFDFGFFQGNPFLIQILFVLYVWLFFLFYVLSQRGNFSLCSSWWGWNRVILFLSKHSLALYWIHIVVFVLLWWLKFSYVTLW